MLCRSSSVTCLDLSDIHGTVQWFSTLIKNVNLQLKSLKSLNEPVETYLVISK